MNYFKAPEAATVIYTIVYDTYIYGCSQQRLHTNKTFKSVKEADDYRLASSYCSPPTNLEFRIVFNRLSNGGWDTERYIYCKDKAINLEELSYAKRDYSPENMEKVNIILKQHDK